jgi:formylmethanofuran dehydrogenase subunit D
VSGIFIDEGKTMLTVTVEDKYVEALAALGDINSAVEVALQRYTIEQITAKISDLRRKDAMYKEKYGQDYPNFSAKIAIDEKFVKKIENKINNTWEIDLAEWEFCYKGIEDWTEKLKNILLI